MEVEKLARFKQRSDGSLQISGLLPDDTGMLQCFAHNAAGEAQTSTYLAVTSKCPPLSSPMRHSVPPTAEECGGSGPHYGGSLYLVAPARRVPSALHLARGKGTLLARDHFQRS